MSRDLAFLLLCMLLLWNVYVFLLYAVDKHKARRERWRISESALLVTAFFCGGIGAWCCMHFVHHKTRNKKILFLVPLALVFTVAALLGLLAVWLDWTPIRPAS